MKKAFAAFLASIRKFRRYRPSTPLDQMERRTKQKFSYGLLIALAATALLDACTLFHQEKGNEPPVLEFSQIDTTSINRSGRINLSVLASDEDDDELFYHWDALGAGTFTDAETAATVWIAPEITNPGSELFLITATIRDRLCDIIPDSNDRQACETLAQASQVQQTFLVEVIQTPPTLQAPGDTLISFTEPFIELNASGNDADGDPLQFTWTQLAGDSLALTIESIDGTDSSLRFVPLQPGDFLFSVQTSDGADSASTQFRVLIEPEESPPGGSRRVSVTLANGIETEYEIDVYEYPNEKGATPLLVNSFFEAEAICRNAGQRLCFAQEWLNACQGTQALRYSSTDDPANFESNFGHRFCNQEGSAVAGDEANPENLAASGSFPNCFSDFGIYDMSGNAAEWVIDVDDSGAIVGRIQLSSSWISGTCEAFNTPLPALPEDFFFGDEAAIEALDESFDSYRREQIGLRCCQDVFP